MAEQEHTAQRMHELEEQVLGLVCYYMSMDRTSLKNLLHYLLEDPLISSHGPIPC